MTWRRLFDSTGYVISFVINKCCSFGNQVNRLLATQDKGEDEMKLYLISQDVNTGWDTYNKVVVAANTENEARNISPSDYGWVIPECVKVKLIGEAIKNTEVGVILASFNSG